MDLDFASSTWKVSERVRWLTSGGCWARRCVSVDIGRCTYQNSWVFTCFCNTFGRRRQHSQLSHWAQKVFRLRAPSKLTCFTVSAAVSSFMINSIVTADKLVLHASARHAGATLCSAAGRSSDQRSAALSRFWARDRRCARGWPALPLKWIALP